MTCTVIKYTCDEIRNPRSLDDCHHIIMLLKWSLPHYQSSAKNQIKHSLYHDITICVSSLSIYIYIYIKYCLLYVDFSLGMLHIYNVRYSFDKGFLYYY